MKTCKVIKLVGETGLRMPGSIYLENDQKAELFEGLGYVEIVDKFEVKEEKTEIDTKELKIELETKAKAKPFTKRGRKPRKK